MKDLLSANSEKILKGTSQKIDAKQSSYFEDVHNVEMFTQQHLQ